MVVLFPRTSWWVIQQSTSSVFLFHRVRDHIPSRRPLPVKELSVLVLSMLMMPDATTSGRALETSAPVCRFLLDSNLNAMFARPIFRFLSFPSQGLVDHPPYCWILQQEPERTWQRSAVVESSEIYMSTHPDHPILSLRRQA